MADQERFEQWPDRADRTVVPTGGGLADVMVYDQSVMIEAPLIDPFEPGNHEVWLADARQVREWIGALQWALGRLEGRGG